MAKIKPDPKVADHDSLKVWYADSLSLMRPAGRDMASDVPSNSSMWQPRLGILQISAQGEELYANGNSETCRAYIKSQRARKTAKPGTRAEQFQGGLIITVRTVNLTRIIFVHRDSLTSIVQEVAPGATLTKAEFHLLQQILCGMSLKHASEVDNVAYETKRTQFKSLAAHLNFSSQSETIRNMLLALTTYALESTGSFLAMTPQDSASIKSFLDSYYPGVFRFHQIVTHDKRVLRVLETGPIDGRPVIWLHSQTLPSPDQFSSNWTRQHNIRLIIPLREGFLSEVETRFSRAEHLVRATQDIVAALDFFCNGRAQIVANSTGVAFALRLAATRPDCVDRLTISAAAYVGRYENQSVLRLVRGLKNLTLQSETLATKALDRYMSKMSSLTGALELLRTTYEKSAYDMDIFNRLLATPLGHLWLYDSYRMSRYSVIKDIAMGGEDVWQLAHKISCKPLFVHGRRDPINNVGAARKAAALIKSSDFVELEHCGQSLFLRRLADLITQSPQQWQAEMRA
ncbi:MAG: alpha/beta hydrolase [Alphaproteobacteria bacterium]|nr:alpha/beta hydrolase [Alphaproteobacteria bacterium]